MSLAVIGIWALQLALAVLLRSKCFSPLKHNLSGVLMLSVTAASSSWQGIASLYLQCASDLCSAPPSAVCHIPECLDLFLHMVYCPRFSSLIIVFCGTLLVGWFYGSWFFVRNSLQNGAHLDSACSQSPCTPRYPNGSFPFHLGLKLLEIYYLIILYPFCGNVQFQVLTFFIEKLERYGIC